ncbi:MAG: AAA domain-containing protein [Syntrophales bacterium]|nr:AAA domain-containing protein [Syntrophales bacterium]
MQNNIEVDYIDKDKIENLIDGYIHFLDIKERNKFIIPKKEDIFYISESLLEKILTKIKEDGYGNFNIFDLIESEELSHELNSFIEKVLSDENEQNKSIGLAFPVLCSEDKKYYAAVSVYPLQYQINRLIVQTVERNNEIYNQFRKSNRSSNAIEKNKTDKVIKHNNTDIAKENNKKDIAIDAIELVLSLGSSFIPLPLPLNLAFSLYTSRQLIINIYRYLTGNKPEDLQPEEIQKKEIEDEKSADEEKENIAFIFTYEKQDFTKKTKEDIKDIKNKLNSTNVATKLGKLLPPFSASTTIQEEMKKVLIEHRWSFFNHDLTESQQSNYERIFHQNILAIEGPPGTGKTHLIATYCMDMMVERFIKEFKGQKFSNHENTVIVTSTNNKAVDNILNKLKEFDSTVENESLTGKFLKGYTRLGDVYKVREFKKELMEFVSQEYKEEEIKENKDKLSDEINYLLNFISDYKAKQIRKEEIEQELSKIYKEIPINEKDKYFYAEQFKNLSQKLFITEEKACNFNRDNLIAFTILLNKLNKIYALFPFISGLLKKRLLYFVEEKGLKILGSKDFKYLSCRELYQRNKDIEKKLEELNDIKTEMEYYEQKFNELNEKKHKLDNERETILNELEEQENQFNYFRKKLLIRLKEFHFWNLLDNKDFINKINQIEDDKSLWSFYKEILKYCPIIISTALSIRNVFPPNPDILETAIVDEGSQTFFCYILPFYFRAKKIVVIGDKNQLEPVKTSIEDTYLNEIFEQLPGYLKYNKSAIETVDEIDKTETIKRRLKEHFRCQKEIIEFCDKLIGYGLKIKTKRERYPFKKELPINLQSIFEKPLAFINIDGKGLHKRKSVENIEEANFIIYLVNTLLNEYVEPTDLAILTPYRAQSDYLKRHLKKINVGTVHTLQGDEKEIVIMSTVCTTSDLFQKSPLFRKTLINVAVSRAKKHFILVGKEEILRQISSDDSPMPSLYKYISDVGTLIHDSSSVIPNTPTKKMS